ncbi:MAG: TolC family protein [Acidobacteria bacterium]|nr:TolC family protein [Acidobacteriota bacterium]
MNLTRLACTLILSASAVSSLTSPATAQEATGAPGAAGTLQMSLTDCVREAFKNNADIRIDSYRPMLSDTDIAFAKAQFDASLTGSLFYQDQKSPTLNSVVNNAHTSAETVIGKTPSNFSQADVVYADPLTTGGRWQADLRLSRNVQPFFSFGPTVAPLAFPETYRTSLTFSVVQPLLRNFGRKVNETNITLSSINHEFDNETFRQRVQDTLFGVEAAYWGLVFARQNLDVANEALRLAQELLKLNQIKVQVGTLPPIDITQAEAGVASKEEAVITARAGIENAQDTLRRVIGMDAKSPNWRASIAPTEGLGVPDQPIDLDQAIKTAIENRPDLSAERLRIKSADAVLYQARNQMKYSLDAQASYGLTGLAGDRGLILPRVDPNTGLPIPGTRIPPDNGPGFQDTTSAITGRDFPTWTAQLTLGIPIGNHAAEANYTKQRLAREQTGVGYQSLEQAAIVQVGLAVRRVETDKKRIQAAEKNRILQEKTVEAEQKKFENGMSTSFQVLTFQNDLATARSRELNAKTDYRISLANLDSVIGVIDKSLNVSLKNYGTN